jgi:hypothetical protein
MDSLRANMDAQDSSQANMDAQDSPQLGLGGSHHLPPYNILCAYTQMLFCLKTPKLKVSKFSNLEAHNVLCKPSIEMKSKEKL